MTERFNKRKARMDEAATKKDIHKADNRDILFKTPQLFSLKSILSQLNTKVKEEILLAC